MAFAQDSETSDSPSEVDYLYPREYEIAGITVSGIQFVDEGALIQISGLSIGEKVMIPGETISKAIKNLWNQKLFSDIEITKTKIQGKYIFLNIHVKEQARLSKFKFNGVSKTEADNLREKVNLYKEKVVTESLKKNTENLIKDYYVDKGYLNCEVIVSVEKDSLKNNHVTMVIDVKKYKKVKINNILIEGNQSFSDVKAKRALKETKEKFILNPFIGLHKFALKTVVNIFKKDTVTFEERLNLFLSERIRPNIFKTSKFEESNFETDKQSLVAKYNDKGFRDAKIISDTLYSSGRNTVDVKIQVYEGKKYYFRNITWLGNTKYSSDFLSKVLGIKKGDVYSQSVLNSRLFMNQNSQDVSSLYMDDGYLFFQINPVEVLVEGDSIDLEMRMFEGQQATINKVTVVGNTKTNDHVIMREIRTKPGQLFSRSDIIRTQRELANLGYFDPEKLNVQPTPNPANSTVDIEYIVEEKPSDQIQLSGGWGGGRIVGTLGVSFTNFSTKNFFQKGAWTPLPSGDGQRLSLSAQANGPSFQSYNVSFTEPWLGGKKPNSFSITGWHSVQRSGITRDAPFIKTSAIAVGLGSRLKWPDDYFTFLHELSFQRYKMDRWTSFIFPDGFANNVYYKATLSRNSIDQPIYPRTG